MRVLVAMSGGVDSSVAAALLQQRGHEVVGVTLDLHGAPRDVGQQNCGGRAAIDAARSVAGQLGIAHQVIDGAERFEDGVLRYCWNEYANGRTPNPCVRCNERVKLALMIEQADTVGATHVATGHHARIVHGPEGAVLRRGHDAHKDQSYFLFALGPQMLARCLFPVGDLTKQQVREAARRLGLNSAERPESQDACFAAEGAFSSELTRRFGDRARPGVIRGVDGRVLGHHEGVHRFTVGQRKGLGVAVGQRAYVVSIDADAAEVVMGTQKDLAASGLVATDAIWWVEPTPGERLTVEAQIRYRHRAAAATLWLADRGELMVEFVEPQQAVTPGQAVVFYREDRVLGGAWIKRALPGTAAPGNA